MIAASKNAVRAFRRPCRCLLCLAILCGGVLPAAEGDAEAAPELSVPAIEERLASLEAEEDLDAEQRTALTEAYRQAVALLRASAASAAKAAGFAERARAAPSAIQELETAPAAVPPAGATVPEEATLEALERAEAAAQAAALQAESRLDELEAELERRSVRRAELPEVLAAQRSALRRLEERLAAATGAPADEAAAAERLVARARRRAIRQRIATCEQELLCYEATRQLLPLRRDQAARELAAARERHAELQARVAERRRREAERARTETEAERRLAGDEPVLRTAARGNAALAEKRSALALRLTDLSRELSETREQHDALVATFTNLDERLRVGGLTAALGKLLLRRRSELPDRTRLRARLAAIRRELSDTQVILFRLEEEREPFAFLERAVEKRLRTLPADTDARRRERVRTALTDLLRHRRELQDALIHDRNTYFGRLVDLDRALRSLLATADELSDYIDEKVLWVRSTAPVGRRTVIDAGKALADLTGPRRWGGVLRWLHGSWALLLPAAGVLGLLVLLALEARRRLRSRYAAADVDGDRAAPRGFAYGLLLTGLAAAPVPVCLLIAAWFLRGRPDAAVSWAGLGVGLVQAAACWWSLAALRIGLTAGEGMFADGDRRDGRPARARESLRLHLRWFLPPLPPLLVAAQAWSRSTDPVYHDALGRLAFIGLLLLVAAFAGVLARPSGPALRFLLPRDRPWRRRLRVPVWFLAVGLPLVMAVLAALGYHYSARQLSVCGLVTLALVLALLAAYALLLRWLPLLQRRLAMRRLQERLEAEEDEGAVSISPEAMAATGSVSDLGQQTRSLLRACLFVLGAVGIWAVWSGVLPAFGVLERIELWTVGLATETGEQTVSIGLDNLVLALLIAVLTVVAARNLPGLLMIGMLQYLPLDYGIRFAVATLARYALVAVGVVLVCGRLGIYWGHVQWILAAMTVGLGFGLQEIFANFVSGLIILFERPMRVGDTVTVGEISGTVTRISIRATTILQWDRKELVVPNREFITGRLVNWSLSDNVLRLVYQTGVAYGSDTARVEEILYAIARGHRHVLDDPAPRVIFTAFGDSALLYELRIYIDRTDWDVHLDTWHEINREIDAAFRAAGIVIAFPQQDVHLHPAGPPGHHDPPIGRPANGDGGLAPGASA